MPSIVMSPPKNEKDDESITSARSSRLKQIELKKANDIAKIKRLWLEEKCKVELELVESRALAEKKEVYEEQEKPIPSSTKPSSSSISSLPTLRFNQTYQQQQQTPATTTTT